VSADRLIARRFVWKPLLISRNRVLIANKKREGPRESLSAFFQNLDFLPVVEVAMPVPIVTVVSPLRCIVVVAAVFTVVMTRRANPYADAPGSYMNIHFSERWHRCRGDENACGNGSKCEFVHWDLSFFRFRYIIKTIPQGQPFRIIFVAGAISARNVFAG
jgi:hypothetical protein